MRRVKRPLLHGEAKAGAVKAMFDAIAPRYDFVNRVMTFGMDVAWRRRAVRALDLTAPATVLDVACGTGDLCRELIRVGHHAIGIDVSAGMLKAARAPVPLLQGDALRIPVHDGAVDGITCGFALRNVADLGVLLAETARILRPGGRIALLEVAIPRSTFLRAGHKLYFHHVVPLIGGVLSDREAYRYLPASTSYLPAQEELLALIRKTGFPDARTQLVGLGAAQIITGTRR